jgi:prepilin-type N-terminal cleavage/methylation domain-containing protein
MPYLQLPHPQPNRSSGFSFIEILVTLALLSGSYLMIFSGHQWIVATAAKQERELKELLKLSDQHELEMAILYAEAAE